MRTLKEPIRSQKEVSKAREEHCVSLRRNKRQEMIQERRGISRAAEIEKDIAGKMRTEEVKGVPSTMIGELVRSIEARGDRLESENVSKKIETEVQQAEIPFTDLENVAMLLKSTSDILRFIGAISL
jgi:hypothetical protein